MASIKEAKRLTVRIYLSNLIVPRGLALTPMFVGPHGIGKTMIVKEAARALGGYHMVVEGGSLKEGEITGLPFASPNRDGSTEVRFVPYFAISNLMKLEKAYFEKARTTGFLGGKLRINEKGETVVIEQGKRTKEDSEGVSAETSKMVEKVLESSHDEIDSIAMGELNAYKFGEDLPYEYKLKLIESGEIKPILFFIDELNRTEQQTMKELMNILLNRNVNGYDIPWWVSIVSAVNPSSQNSTYSTNEIDDAQRDRFLKIKVDARLDDWIDYALDKRLNQDIIEGIAVAEAIFMHKEKGYEDMDEMTPSPRSWEMVSYIYESIDKFNHTKFLSAEDKKEERDDLRTLIAAKVGPTAARTILENINNKENNIKPQEIVNGKSDKLDEKIVNKFRGQKRLRQKITVDNLIRHLASVIVDFEKYKKATKAEEKKIYFNFKEQLKAFIEILDDATKIAFAKKLTDNSILCEDNKPLFGKISDCFATNILQSFMEFDSSLKKLGDE